MRVPGWRGRYGVMLEYFITEMFILVMQQILQIHFPP